MNMTMIERGKNYPLQLGNMEGARADFLTTDGNLLLIGMPGIQSSEVKAIRKGQLKAGFIKDGPLILWVFEFPNNLIFDCPFDVRIIPRNRLQLPDVTNDRQRLYIDVHLVDTTTNVVKALRGVTLHPALSRDFLSAVQEQLTDSRSAIPMLNRYNAIDLLHLPKMAAVRPCGENS